MATAMVEAIDTAQMSLPATGGSLTGVTAMATLGAGGGASAIGHDVAEAVCAVELAAGV